jgi:hypothetical protein
MPPETVVIALSHEEAQVYDSESKTLVSLGYVFLDIRRLPVVLSGRPRVRWR